MNLELKRFQLSRIGNHRDSNGIMHHFTNELLQDVADEFNRRPKGENNPNPAPLYIGHPAQCKTPPEPLGIVSKLEFTDGKLYALAYATAELVNLIRRGIYRHVSAGFDRMKYGGIRLNHIALAALGQLFDVVVDFAFQPARGIGGNFERLRKCGVVKAVFRVGFVPNRR